MTGDHWAASAVIACKAVSFISMIAQAQALMTCYGARTALLCNVQNSAGRLFASEQTRKLKQARIPGDGCGVGYLVASAESPVKAVVQFTKQAFAYVFDRTNGRPVWPWVEKPVPQTTVPGEWTSPTQPFPSKPPGLRSRTWR